MTTIAATLSAIGILLIAWGVAGFVRVWWAWRQRRRQCGAVYLRASEPLIRGQLVVRDGNGAVRAARAFVATDTSGLRVNPTPDGDTDEGR